jgi:hypothetical protein
MFVISLSHPELLAPLVRVFIIPGLISISCCLQIIQQQQLLVAIKFKPALTVKAIRNELPNHVIRPPQLTDLVLDLGLQF